MTLLDYDYLNYFSNNNPIYPFEYTSQKSLLVPQDDQLFETELMCFDVVPPSLLEFELDFEVPHFNPPPPPPPPPAPIQLDQYFVQDDELIIPEKIDYSCIEYPHPLFLPTEDNYSYEEFFPLHKKQKLCDYSQIDGIFPEFSDLLGCESLINEAIVAENYPSYQHFDNTNVNGGACSFNVGCGGNAGGGKVREVSAQSRAARERRRKISEKTQELGKLVPGGTKMNTAEMFQAAGKYVKFLQAQMSILKSIKSLHQEHDKKANFSNLQILDSQLVQEKLYSKDFCLVPMDTIPIFEEYCDFEEDPSILNQINELLH